MNYLQTALVSVLCIGTIDSIDNGVVHVEITSTNNEIRRFDIPALLLPCEVSEQDVFYFLYVDGVVEVRCGEPPV